jgi:hypothetical protein
LYSAHFFTHIAVATPSVVTLKPKKQGGLTWERNTEDEDGDGNNENDGWDPAHRPEVVRVYRHIPSATVCLCLDIFLSNLLRDLTLSVFRWSFVLVLFRREVPVGEV